MQFVKINYPETKLLEKFISQAGSSLNSFRYFSKRPLSVIQQHICTWLLTEGDEPLAYGHLDKENDHIWLGIAVVEAAKGKGLGKLMIKQLIDSAYQTNIKNIRLSVDNENQAAINLYKSLGFLLLEKKESFSFYLLELQ